MTEREDFEKWYDGKTDSNGGVAYYVDITGRCCFPDIEAEWQRWKERHISKPAKECQEHYEQSIFYRGQD